MRGNAIKSTNSAGVEQMWIAIWYKLGGLGLVGYCKHSSVSAGFIGVGGLRSGWIRMVAFLERRVIRMVAFLPRMEGRKNRKLS